MQIDKTIGHFFSPGKLLITGEYVIMKGAKGWALPTRFGQTMEVEQCEEPGLRFNSHDSNGLFFSGTFNVETLEVMDTSSEKDAEFVHNLLVHLKDLKPGLFLESGGKNFKSKVQFNRSYGFGSSSSFISNLAKWAGVDGFTFHQKVSAGSGYDVVVAMENEPITYRKNAKSYAIEKRTWGFKDKHLLRFIYSNKKQATEQHILRFNPDEALLKKTINKVNNITEDLLACKYISELKHIVNSHEEAIGEILSLDSLKKAQFLDYQGALKSLGAWGGDFFMAAHENVSYTESYFKERGFNVIFKWNDLFDF